MSQVLKTKTLNYISKEKDSEGRLFLKFYVADSSINKMGFGVTPESLPIQMPKGVGKPYVLTDGKTLFPGGNPWHPFSWELNPTVDTEVRFARDNFGIGECVMMTPYSRMKGAAMNPLLKDLDIQEDGWLSVIEVTNEEAKEHYDKDDGYIPPQISIGFLVDKEQAMDQVVSKYDIVHFAACPNGAYGDKTHVWMACHGNKIKCMDVLRGAADLEKQNSAIMSSQIKPINVTEAIENIKKINSYDVTDLANKNNMVEDKGKPEDSKPEDEVKADDSEQKNEQKNGQQTELETKEEPETNANDVSDKSKEVQTDIQNPDSKLVSRIEELEKVNATNARREEIRSQIPPQLFNSQEEWNKEVELRLKQKVSNELLKEIYTERLAHKAVLDSQAVMLDEATKNPFAGFQNDEVATTEGNEPGQFRGAAVNGKVNNADVEMITKAHLLCSQLRSVKPSRV